MQSQTAAPIESLLAHRAWIRAVARAVARDDALADDLEQDAWVAALRRRPVEGAGSLRAWFATVIERRHRERHRSETRRAARDLVAAPRSDAPSTAALVAEAEAHERVVRAVLALAETHRDVVLLRYFEGLPPREIARRTGAPVETVRSRIKRAVEILRERLGEGRPVRSSDWLMIFAAASSARGGASAAGKTALAAGAVAKVSAVGAVIVLAILLLSRTGEDVTSDAPTRGVATVPPASDPTVAPQAAQARRRPAEAPPAEAAPVAPAAAVGGTVTGRVVTPDGRPVAGAAVKVPGLRWSETDAEGRFEIRGVFGERVPIWVVAAGARATPVELVTVGEGARKSVGDVVVAPAGEAVVRGRVVSKAGLPVAGGRVAVSWSYPGVDGLEALADPPFARLIDYSATAPAAARAWRDLSTTVAEDGTFEMRLPVIREGMSLVVSIPRHHVTGTAELLHLQAGGEETVRFEVLPLTRARGFVVDAADGRPIAGAAVAFAQPDLPVFGEHAVRTRADGSFDVTAGEDWGWDMIGVSCPGYLMAILPRERGSTVEDLRIAMRKQRRIAGVVVFPDGRPVKGAVVFVSQPDAANGDPTVLEAGNNVTTGDGGAFEFPKVWDGTWTLTLIAEWSNGTEDFVPPANVAVEAGRDDVRIVVQPAKSIDGAVVDEDGRPVPQFSVVAKRGGSTVSVAHLETGGRFRIRGVAGAVDLEVAAAAYVPVRLQGVEVGAGELRIVMRRGLAIDGVVVDEDGRPVSGRRIVASPAASDPFTTTPAPLPFAEPGPNGALHLSGLSPGAWRLEALGAPFDDRRRLVGGERVTAGATGVRLVLVAGGAIEGVVVDAQGAPAAKVRVDVLFDVAAAEGLNATTDEDGRFRVTGLPPGRNYTVVARGVRVLDVAPGTKDFRLVVGAEK